MVLPDSHGIPRAPRYSGILKGRHIVFVYGTITHYGFTFQKYSTNNILCNFPTVRYNSHLISHNPGLPTHIDFNSRRGLGSCPFAHHYLGNRYYFLFLGLLRCFSSPRRLQQPMNSAEDILINQDELSHSEIPGSKDVCSYPRLIAASHALLRQPMPRHPPPLPP